MLCGFMMHANAVARTDSLAASWYLVGSQTNARYDRFVGSALLLCHQTLCRIGTAGFEPAGP